MVDGRRQRALTGHVLSAVVVLLVLTFGAFSLIRVTPGSTATSIAVRQAGPGASQEQIERIRHELKLDESVVTQYGVWLTRALRGDLGRSERSGRPIAAEIGEKLPRTVFLGLGSALLALVMGFGAGIVAAVVRRGPLPGVLRAVALVGVSVPTFWMSFVLIAVFSERLGLLPTSGQSGPVSWIMPWLVLAIPAAGTISRVVAVSLSEALRQQYVTAARARGVAAWSPTVRDALPNAVGATLNVTALQLGTLLTGSVVVETVFGWPGVGAWFVDSVTFRDSGAILAGVLVFAVAFILLTRTIDVVQTAADPRLRRTEVR